MYELCAVKSKREARPFSLEQLGRIHPADEDDLVHSDFKKLAKNSAHVPAQRRFVLSCLHRPDPKLVPNRAMTLAACD